MLCCIMLRLKMLFALYCVMLHDLCVVVLFVVVIVRVFFGCVSADSLCLLCDVSRFVFCVLSWCDGMCFCLLNLFACFV